MNLQEIKYWLQFYHSCLSGKRQEPYYQVCLHSRLTARLCRYVCCRTGSGLVAIIPGAGQAKPCSVRPPRVSAISSVRSCDECSHQGLPITAIRVLINVRHVLQSHSCHAWLVVLFCWLTDLLNMLPAQDEWADSLLDRLSRCAASHAKTKSSLCKDSRVTIFYSDFSKKPPARWGKRDIIRTLQSLLHNIHPSFTTWVLKYLERTKENSQPWHDL